MNSNYIKKEIQLYSVYKRAVFTLSHPDSMSRFQSSYFLLSHSPMHLSIQTKRQEKPSMHCTFCTSAGQEMIGTLPVLFFNLAKAYHICIGKSRHNFFRGNVFVLIESGISSSPFRSICLILWSLQFEWDIINVPSLFFICQLFFLWSFYTW